MHVMSTPEITPQWPLTAQQPSIVEPAPIMSGQFGSGTPTGTHSPTMPMRARLKPQVLSAKQHGTEHTSAAIPDAAGQFVPPQVAVVGTVSSHIGVMTIEPPVPPLVPPVPLLVPPVPLMVPPVPLPTPPVPIGVPLSIPLSSSSPPQPKPATASAQTNPSALNLSKRCMTVISPSPCSPWHRSA
jgi:hypothetical protein